VTGREPGADRSPEPVFLRPDVIIEPLVDRFYAWLHTVSPVPAAMNLAFAQIPLLESYLRSPKVHVNASRNPALRGGMFVSIEASRSEEVRELLASIKRDRAPMLDLAAAVVDAEEIVRQGATGFDLTPLYPKLPPVLAGLVELAYDTNNQPLMRYLEPLAYQSGFYTEDRQSVQLSLETGVERPFVLSTPQLSGHPRPADPVPPPGAGGTGPVQSPRQHPAPAAGAARARRRRGRRAQPAPGAAA
jgi:hypothetical protein